MKAESKSLLSAIAVRRLLLALGLTAYFAAAFLIMKHTGVGCVFRHFIGIPCPGCGMTRALICVLELDFAGAFSHNPVIFFMPYIFGYIFFGFKGKIHNYILAGIGVLAIINWGINVYLTLTF